MKSVKVDANTPKTLDFEKMIYRNDDFFVITAADIGQLSKSLARQIIKFRLLLRNNALVLRDAINCWQSINDVERSACLAGLRSRMASTARHGSNILIELEKYEKRPRDEDPRYPDKMWPDWQKFEEARNEIARLG